MRQRQTSIADSLVQSGTLLAQRFRLEGLVHRTATATIHLATHRNGSTAWIKLPFAKTHADQITREASVANTIASPLLVRDDGTTSDGIPYLILEPPDGESLKALRARTKAGARLPLARVMTLGDALARVVASVHALGYVTAGLADDDVLAFANGEVALLDLHALVPSTKEGIAGDVEHVVRALKALLDDVAEPGQGREAIAAVLASSPADVADLQLAWRTSSPEPVVTPVRMRPGSFADVPSSGRFGSEPQIGRTAHATPLAMAIPLAEPQIAEAPVDFDGSRIDYLRSGARSAPPPAGLREKVVLDDPLAKMRELPRLVQAASRTSEPEAKPGRAGFVVGASLAALAAMAMIAAGVFVFERTPSASASALELKRPAPAAPAPAAAARDALPAPVATFEEPVTPAEDDLQMTSVLRSDGAPVAREVFLDGRPVGKTPLHVMVPCGEHTLQMVAGASKQTVDLPCGGEAVVRYDRQGRWSLRSK